MKIKISNEVRSHIDIHFHSDLTGSKFYAKTPDALLEMALQLFPESFSSASPDADGRVRVSLCFPYDIGVSNVVHIDELSDDEKKRIIVVDRNGVKVRCAKIERIFPTKECQLIFSSSWDLITMFPGEMAPPLPISPQVHDCYWDNHVFVTTD